MLREMDNLDNLRYKHFILVIAFKRHGKAEKYITGYITTLKIPQIDIHILNPYPDKRVLNVPPSRKLLQLQIWPVLRTNISG